MRSSSRASLSFGGVFAVFFDRVADAVLDVAATRAALFAGQATHAGAGVAVAAAGVALVVAAAAAYVESRDARGLATIRVALALHAEAGGLEAHADHALVVLGATRDGARVELAASARGAGEATWTAVLAVTGGSLDRGLAHAPGYC